MLGGVGRGAFVIGHGAPEAQVGAPLALVKVRGGKEGGGPSARGCAAASVRRGALLQESSKTNNKHAITPQDGDNIVIDASTRRMDMSDVSDEELAKRRVRPCSLF